MLYESRRDGSVRRYDLRDPNDLRDCLRDPRRVTSLALASDGGDRVDLPRPRRFRRVSYVAELLRDVDGEPVAERIVATCDDVVVSLTMSFGDRAGRVRVDLDRLGERRFRPTGS